MSNKGGLYWVWLAQKCGAASKQLAYILSLYSDPFDVFMLESEEIERMELTDWLKARLCQKSLEESYKILGDCEELGIDIITYADPRYPKSLRRLMDPPAVLYCKGSLPDFDQLCIGIVGTRKMTEYGKQMAYSIAYELGGARVLTVSGMALGIDGVAACGALASGGQTVAVLGTGVDTAYPKSHSRLMEFICKRGAVISEYPPKEEARSYNFPKRNRIISGLCQGVLVVEAAAASGALITAEDAIMQGKEVFAVPGKVGEVGAKGPNELIKKGAYTVLSAADIFKHYESVYKKDYKMDSLYAARAKAIDVETALEKCGLYYALRGGAPIPIEPVYSVKRGSYNTPKPAPAQVRADKAEAAREARAQTAAQVKSSSPAAEAPQNKERSVDEAAIGRLDDVTRRIYDAMPQGKAVSADVLLLQGLTTVNVLTSLSLLELEGLISSRPGGLYVKT